MAAGNPVKQPAKQGGAESDRRQAVFAKARELAAEFAKTYPVRDQKREFPREEMIALKKSGLPGIIVPTEYGGAGLSFSDLVEVVGTLATGNPAIAQMFAAHAIVVWLLIPRLPESSRQRLCKEIVEDNAFVANASGERFAKSKYAWETRFHPVPGGVRIKGRKFFSTGSLACDRILILGVLEGTEGTVSGAFVPRDTQGLVIHDDWTPAAMGQRGTSSGTTELNDVFVPQEWVITKLAERDAPDPAAYFVVFAPMLQVCFSAIFVGAASAALNHAMQYVKTKTRPWVQGGVERVLDDPYILLQVGKMKSYLLAGQTIIRHAATAVDGLLAVYGKPVEAEGLAQLRAETMVTTAQAKVVATEVSLRVCEEVFQVCGSRATLAEEDFDRYWRDVRTLTLHDPVNYQAKLVGEFLFEGKHPKMSPVS